MNCPVCNSLNYHLYTRYEFKDQDELATDDGKVYKTCLDCRMRTGYYNTQAELEAAESRNPFKRADW